MENAYAQALWSIVERGATPADAVRHVREALERQGRMRLMPKIAHAVQRLAERDKSRNGITLYVAREHDAHAAAEAAGKALERMGITSGEFDVRVDASLIGGWRLEGAGILIDGSFRSQLLEMYNRAVQ